ncbi:glycosyltransferase family 2 protein [Agromyces protaetiae]|uniref:Glycosyltransferase family 2 protein n=1 Tax=Agromyces protaetiae TaxID=2509455 RepID=A0A4P6FFN9_9MICO|nr:glycosyltransferase family 2 protein [Agromyces protaetiae]QAY74716.1 glycosyltransferase family 2 protein [Agromyces protaetiae]
MTKISVVVVNFRTSSLLDRLIRSLDVDHELIVVDNFSSERELELVRGALPAGALLVQQDNVGFAAGVNAGVARARAENDVLVVNPDAWFASESIGELQSLAHAENADVASPLILSSGDGTIWFDGGRVLLRSLTVEHLGFGAVPADFPTIRETSFMSGCIMLISPAARRALFPLREDLFLYYEDVDLSLRAQSLGMCLLVVRSAVAFHDEGGASSSDVGRRSAGYYFYQSRNRLILARELRSARALIATPLVSARLIARIFRREDKRSLKSRAVVQGVVAGLRGRKVRFE